MGPAAFKPQTGELASFPSNSPGLPNHAQGNSNFERLILSTVRYTISNVRGCHTLCLKYVLGNTVEDAAILN